MSIKFNPREFIDDMVEQGYSKEEAVKIAKEHFKDRKKDSQREIKARNDAIMKSRGLT